MVLNRFGLAELANDSVCINGIPVCNSTSVPY